MGRANSDFEDSVYYCLGEAGVAAAAVVACCHRAWGLMGTAAVVHQIPHAAAARSLAAGQTGASKAALLVIPPFTKSTAAAWLPAVSQAATSSVDVT
jgi:hypothetical protein